MKVVDIAKLYDLEKLKKTPYYSTRFMKQKVSHSTFP